MRSCSNTPTCSIHAGIRVTHWHASRRCLLRAHQQRIRQHVTRTIPSIPQPSPFPQLSIGMLTPCWMPHLQKLQAAAAAAEEERFQQHLAQVTDAVQQRSGVLGEVDALLEAQAHVKARQQRQMYEQWSQQVFEQIQVRGRAHLSWMHGVLWWVLQAREAGRHTSAAA